MFQKLDDLLMRYEDLTAELNNPSVVENQTRFRKLMKEQSDLTPLVDAYKEYKACQQTVADSLEMLDTESDEELREMAKEELNEAKARIEELEHTMKILLLPKDPNDDKNVIVEIRAGAGGDEAALFAAELFRMYTHYVETKRWKVEVINADETGIGGMKEVEFMVKGQGAYSILKYESGVHRVQRVPETESGGRIHTSTITVAIMPEAEEVDIDIDPKDLRIDTYRSSGAGGQHINKTDSAVRITHIPTGIVATSQDGRSQHDNRAKAMQSLRTRVYEAKLREEEEKLGNERRNKIGSGDRAEKIRTYNYPQNRVTDHRIGLTIQQLDRIMEGKLEPIIDALINEDQRLKLLGEEE